MFNIVKNIVYRKSQKALGLDVFINNDNSYHIRAVLIETRLNEVNVIEAHTFNTFQEVIQKLNDNKMPVTIGINGKGILHKKVILQNYSDQELLDEIIPNSVIDDFYFVRNKIKDELTVFSLCRSNVIDSILIDASALNVVSVVLGVFIPRVPFLTNDIEYVSVKGTELYFEENVLSNVVFSNHFVPSTTPEDGFNEMADLFPFALAINSFRDEFNTVRIAGVDQKQKLHRQGVYFRKTAPMMFFIVSLVLIPCIVANIYFYFVLDELKGELSKSNFNYVEYLDLKKKYDVKREYFQKQMYSNYYTFSFLSEDIVLELPDNIKFSKMKINPIEYVKNTDSVRFVSNQIVIQGECNSTVEFNNWFKKLKEKSWVKNLNIINISKSDELDYSDFEIHITINDEK